MRVLRGGVQRVGSRRFVVLPQGRTRLDGVWDETVVDDVNGGDVVRSGECRVRRCLVAQFPVVALVVGRRLVDLIGVGRGGEIHDCGQFLEIRIKRLCAVPGRRQGFADHQGVRFANVIHARHRDRRMRRLDHVRAVLRLDHPATGQITDRIGLQIRAGEHRHHAVRRHRGAAVDAVEFRSRVLRAGKHRIGLAVLPDIVGVATSASDETRVFLALDRSADAGFSSHCQPSYMFSCAAKTALTMLW